jgi:hypothetical protein
MPTPLTFKVTRARLQNQNLLIKKVKKYKEEGFMYGKILWKVKFPECMINGFLGVLDLNDEGKTLMSGPDSTDLVDLTIGKVGTEPFVAKIPSCCLERVDEESLMTEMVSDLCKNTDQKWIATEIKKRINFFYVITVCRALTDMRDNTKTIYEASIRTHLAEINSMCPK